MTTTKHTPGPWECYIPSIGVNPNDTDDKGNYYWQIEPQTITFDEQYLCIAGWMSEANARLIAAAPEMFEALEFFVERFSPVEHELIFSKRHALQKARAAIAKATGENQLNRP